jgi:hypothetical protein
MMRQSRLQQEGARRGAARLGETKKGKPDAGLPLLVRVMNVEVGVRENEGSCLPLLNHKRHHLRSKIRI